MSYHTVFFTSQHKDNKNIEGFKPRSKSFLSDKTVEDLTDEFSKFVGEGVIGETSFFYISVNASNIEKSNRALIHYLIDHPHAKPHQITQKLVNYASLKENRESRKWLLDVDNPDDLDDVLEALKEFLKEEEMKVYKTVNGYHVVTDRGFYSDKILAKFPEVKIKKNANRLIYTDKKDE